MLYGIKLEDTLADFHASRADNLLEELDEHSTAVFFRQTAQASTAWCLLARCGFCPEAYLNWEEFAHLRDFDTYGVVSCLGASVSDASQRVLRDLERHVKRWDREQVLQGGTEHGIELSAERRVSAAGSAAGGERRDVREVRDAAEVLPTGAPEGDIHQPADPGKADRLSGGDRPDSPDADRADCGGHEGRGRRDGGIEGQGPHGLDGPDERPEAPGGGRDLSGADLPINEIAADNSAAFFMPKLPTVAEQRELTEDIFGQLSLFSTVEEAQSAEDRKLTCD